MKHNNSGNAAYIPQEEYYDGGGYLGYGGYNEKEGCRRLFFTFLIWIVLMVVAGILIVVL